VRQVGAELTAPLAGLLFRQGVTLADRWFGSFLPPGSVSALGYAGKITQVLAGTVFGAVATAGLPALAGALANGQQQEAAWRWRSMLRLSVAVAVPLGLGLALLSRPFVRLLFENHSRNLESGSTILLANVLAIYALSLIPLGPFRAQQSYLFAARQANWVAGLLFLVTSITLALDWLFVKWLGAIGLGLAFTFGVSVSLALGFVMVKKASPPILEH
jgi:putative peptidoglycan lipid II flippase